MTDFVGAFQRGQRAAEDAARARAEVESVLQNLKQQFAAATNGVLEIAVERDTLSTITDWARVLANSEEAEFATKVILARNLQAANQPRAALGRFEMPVEGFPCVVRFGRREERCHDVEALERAFEEMLQDTAIGRALHRLLAEPRAETTSPEGPQATTQAGTRPADGS